MNTLENKNILLGVTGGIAAYKSASLVSALKKAGANVKVVMTKNATEFVSPLTFEALSSNKVYVEMFNANEEWEINHISLTKWADLFVIAPCTANVIAKAACGIADDLLTSTILASKADVVLAPAMNTRMYENEATKANISLLKSRGIKFIDADEGLLACGDSGKGRMAEPEEIVKKIEFLLNAKRDMSGMRVIVTAGPTREYIDPVRFISNPSTGKMGYAIAAECASRGAGVHLVSGPVNISKPCGVQVHYIETVEQMYCKVMPLYNDSDMVFKAAAVGDFKPEVFSGSKIKKNSGKMTIELENNIDILKQLGENKTNQFLCGFAAETDDILKNAEEKLKSKNLDMIFVNNVSGSDTGFAKDTNAGYIISTDGSRRELEVADKSVIAREIVDAALELRTKGK